MCDEEPPEALLRAALDIRNCPSCGGLIELNRFGGSWFATLARSKACAWCSAHDDDSGPNAAVLQLSDFR